MLCGCELRVLIVVLLVTFSRSETPCPKTFGGFDPAHHWQSKDIRWRCVDALYCLAVRFKTEKQDPRNTRRSASDGGDWSYVGDVPGPFSVLRRFQVFMRFFAAERDAGEAPFFLARDRGTPTHICRGYGGPEDKMCAGRCRRFTVWNPRYSGRWLQRVGQGKCRPCEPMT